MNRIYSTVWNVTKGIYIVTHEKCKSKSPKKSSKKNATSKKLAGLVLFSTIASSNYLLAADLPTGGVITSGTGTINQSANTLTITQNTSKLATDWQSFSIGQGNTVNFIQPSSSAVALNRVLGSDVSVIQGALTANGQVFLTNPNGVTFTPTAQVNVGGIVATTLNLSNADFNAGHYKFEGASANAILNQGNITAVNGGTIALIAAKITNTGNLTANAGNVLLGAGSKVTLDLGGPVKLLVENDALETLINNGGAIKADGGTVLLTSQAASTLASSAINNTGIIEAQTLATGETGEIVLYAHDGIAHIGGKLDASAPNGGDGGFIETSAQTVSFDDNLQVTAASANGVAGKWLIDPTDITISAASCTGTNCIAANTITSTLSGGTDVAIATASAGPAAGNITVNSPISWTSNKLTLSAHNNININATLNATGTGSLALEYGLASANGGTSTYNVATGSKIYIPSATAFTWKKGSAGTTNNLVFNNGNLRFGNGTQASINSNGLLEQPWYFDNTSVVSGVQRNAWYKLTFSNYALNQEIGAGGDGTNSWNRNGSLLDSQTNLAGAISGRSIEISGFKEGSGTVLSTVDLSFSSGELVRVENTYTLAPTAAFIKTDTSLTNIGASTASNLRLWVGTQDDYVATRDSQYKFKGNLTENGFEQIPVQTDQAKALKITEFNDGTGAAILFYSISNGADTSIAQCCSFTNATGINPRTSQIWRGPEDGSYALFIRLADLNVGQGAGMTWYYAAAPAALITNVVNEVSVSAGATPPPTPPQPSAPPPSPNTITQDTAVESAQHLASHAEINPEVHLPIQISEQSSTQSALGSLDVIEVSSSDSTDSSDANIWTQLSEHQGNTDSSKIFVVNGGIHLPEAAQE